MTTLAELRVKVSRDIRDPLNKTFLTAYVDDLINAGMDEVSRIHPREVVDAITPVASTYTYATTLQTAFRLEWLRSNVVHKVVAPHPADDTGRDTGWDLFGGTLYLPKGVVDATIPATDDFALWGYASRAQLTSDGQVAQLEDDTEWAVRHYAKATAFSLMQQDRSLFKQWQAQSLNTDVTNNQMSQMVAMAAGAWDRDRNYLRQLRRV